MKYTLKLKQQYSYIAVSDSVYISPCHLVVDCGPPVIPNNANISLSAGTTFNSVATYTCHSCYHRMGVSVQICLETGVWIPNPPTCESEYSIWGYTTVNILELELAYKACMVYNTRKLLTHAAMCCIE